MSSGRFCGEKKKIQLSLLSYMKHLRCSSTCPESKNIAVRFLQSGSQDAGRDQIPCLSVLISARSANEALGRFAVGISGYS